MTATLRSSIIILLALSKEAGLDPSNAIRVIAREPFTSDDAYLVGDYLDTLQKVIRRKYLYYTGVKDQITDSLTRTIGHEELVRLRETTYNEELADLVLNRTVQKKVYDTPDRIIQKSDPGTDGAGITHTEGLTFMLLTR